VGEGEEGLEYKMQKRNGKKDAKGFFFFSLTWVSGPACAHLD
jgi:hypothetical protein